MNMVLVKANNADVFINLDAVTEIWNKEYEDGRLLVIYFGTECTKIHGEDTIAAWETIFNRIGDASVA